MEPLISIIIPCRNAAPWLAQSLQSVSRQTLPPHEIIVVDDASTDASPGIARSFPGVRLLPSRGRGQCAACNTGLAAASGSFIKFFDADDLLDPDMLRLQTQALADKPRHLAYGEWARFQTDPSTAVFTPLPEWQSAPPVPWLHTAWKNGEGMMQCGLYLIPRPLLETTGGWDERLSLINDLEFFTRLTLASDGVRFTPGARLFYRSNLPGALSATRDRAAWESAALSATLASGHLLARDNSQASRSAAATMLQELAFTMFPNCPDLVHQLESQARSLGGGLRSRPRGGRPFQLLSRCIGWKNARRLQFLAGKYPRPLIG